MSPKVNINYVNHEITDADILYEDNHLIAVNKRAGDIVQVDDTGDESLDEKVKKYLAKKYNKPNGAFLGVVHRLDRPVSGLILFAKTSKGLDRMNNLFKRRDIQKTYYAVVRNRPEPIEGELDGYYLLEVYPITGRPHQIRVQLSTLGCPIVGDNKYGYPRGSLKNSISLHARRLKFIHPIKLEPVEIVAELPKDGFWEKFAGMIE